MIYVYMIVAAAFIALGAYARFEQHEAAAFKQERDAAVEQNTALRTEIDTQNKAVAALKATGDAKIADATKSLKAANTKASNAEAEAARLRQAAQGGDGRRGPAKGCAPSGADKAVAELRKGLL